MTECVAKGRQSSELAATRPEPNSRPAKGRCRSPETQSLGSDCGAGVHNYGAGTPLMEILGMGESMRGSWIKHPLTSFVVFFSLGGHCFHKAMVYASAAPGELSTITHVHKRDTIKHSLCDYSFTADGVAQKEQQGDCPRELASGYSDATVYYDPSNPSINSSEESGVESKYWYQYAAPIICVGCVAIGIAVLNGAPANGKRGKGGIVADPAGTVIYQKKIDPNRQDSADSSKPAGFSQNESDRSANDRRARLGRGTVEQ